MRLPIALLALWLTAAIACMTLGWMTVGMVSGQSRESTLQPLIQSATTRDDTQQAFVGPRPAVTPGSTTSTSTSTSTPTTTTTTVPGTTLEALPPADGAGPPADTPVPGVPSPQAPAAAPRPPAPAPTTVPALPPPPPQPVNTPSSAPSTSATIASRGGSVAVRYDGTTGTVTLLGATPSDGFTMNLHDTGPDEVEVRFESDDAESRVFAWWDGAPRQRVEETD